MQLCLRNDEHVLLKAATHCCLGTFSRSLRRSLILLRLFR